MNRSVEEWSHGATSRDGDGLRQTSIHLPVDLHKRVRKYAFDQEVTLSTVMVDAIQEWLDAREG
jgi:hypothetical protein